jgi:hypothetical protein
MRTPLLRQTWNFAALASVDQTNQPKTRRIMAERQQQQGRDGRGEVKDPARDGRLKENRDQGISKGPPPRRSPPTDDAKKG